MRILRERKPEPLKYVPRPERRAAQNPGERLTLRRQGGRGSSEPRGLCGYPHLFAHQPHSWRGSSPDPTSDYRVMLTLENKTASNFTHKSEFCGGGVVAENCNS